MPIPLPPRANVVRARKHETFVKFDWLGVWALSLGFCAINLAGITYFLAGDNIGASLILVGVAVIIAVIVCLGGAPQESQ
jgi:hypothetical protein